MEPFDRRRAFADRGELLACLRTLYGDDGPARRDVFEVHVALRRLGERARDPVGVRRVGHDVEVIVVDPPHDDVVEHGRVVGIE